MHTLAKMGRPKIDNPLDKKITIRIDKSTDQKLTKASIDLNTTKNQVIRNAIESYCKALEEQ